MVNCGRRFGKTALAVEEMKGKAIAKPSRVCYIAPTYQQARDIAWELLKKELAPVIISANESRLEIKCRTFQGGESIIVLHGWESVETLRGQWFDFIVIDEIASMASWDTQWEAVIRPTLTDKKGEALFISTPKGFNHFYELYNRESDPIKGKDYKSFHFTSYDNPHIDPGELDIARIEVTEDRFAQEYLADFRKQEGLVYKEFSRANHIFTDDDLPEKIVEKIGGIDFGYTNPACILTIVQDYDNKYWVTDEFYERKHTDAEIAERVSGMGFSKVYPDPENAAAVKELTTRGVNIRVVNKGNDSIVNGIQKVRNLFKEGRLKIHRRCTNLIFELETYCYPERKDKKNPQELPIKENDHAADCLRYILMTHTVSYSRKAHIFVPSNLRRG